MKIFITGATGFIGRHVVELLAKKHHELMLLVRNKTDTFDKFATKKQLNFIVGDLSNIDKCKGSLRDFKPDATLYLAWQGIPDYGVEMCKRNLRYGEDFFTTMAQIGCKCIVSAGSCWEYKKLIGRLNEDSEIESSKPFPAAKNSLRLIGEDISKEYDLKFYWPRIFYVYGPGQRNTSLIPYIIHSFRDGIRPEAKNPHNKNDFVYVKDVAEAIAGIIEKKPGNMVYNIGSGYSVSVREVISIVSEIMGCQFDIDDVQPFLNGQGDGDFWADISNIRDDLGWSPKYSLSDGIKEMIEYYAGRKEKVKAK